MLGHHLRRRPNIIIGSTSRVCWDGSGLVSRVTVIVAYCIANTRR